MPGGLSNPLLHARSCGSGFSGRMLPSCRLLCFLLLVPQQAVDAALSCDAEDTEAKAAGDAFPLCVFLSSDPVRRMVFQIKVEESAELVLKGSDSIALQNNSIYAWVSRSQAGPAHPTDCSNETETASRGGNVSCPQIYANADNIAQLTNLVINLRDGRVGSFVWDNGCSGCAPSRCMAGSESYNVEDFTPGASMFKQGTCGKAREDCIGNQNACDLKIFVTWAGTDKQGRNLLSAGTRLSKLAGPTLRSLFETMQEGYNMASQAVTSR